MRGIEYKFLNYLVRLAQVRHAHIILGVQKAELASEVEVDRGSNL